MSNKKSRISQLLFKDALLNRCASKWISTVWQIRCLSRFFLLLIVLPDILLLLVIFIPIARVLFFPPNITTLIQPMDQGVRAASEAYYLRMTCCCSRRRHWEHTGALLEGLQHLWLYQEPCLGWCHQGIRSGIWKKTFKRFDHDSTKFAKEEEVAKITKTAVEKANKFTMGVDEDIGERLEGIPEESTNEEVLGLEPERIAEEEAREGNCRRRKRRTSKKLHSEGVSRSFCRPQQAP